MQKKKFGLFYIQNQTILTKEIIKINRIAVVLKEKDIQQKELATRLHIDQTTLSKYCTNKVQPTLHFLYKIATELEIDIRDLLHPTISKTSNPHDEK